MCKQDKRPIACPPEQVAPVYNMQMLGATPRCAACGKLAYHAEQVMGPGRKIYHKPCLQCVNCKKRLDPGALVEHDTEPYCKRCHGLLFGTRDLRSANVFSSSTNAPPVTPPRPSAHQQSSPSIQQSPSPAHQTGHQYGSSVPHTTASPRRTFDPSPSHASPLSSSWKERGAHEDTRPNNSEQNDPSLENGHVDSVTSTQKRPLPRLPPKPAPLHSSQNSSTYQSVHTALLPMRGTERSESVDPAREDDSAQVGIDGSRSTENQRLQETQPTEPRHPETPPTSNSAALDFPHTEKRFTSIDDAINSATTTTDHLPKLSLDATPQPKLSHREASHTTTNIRDPVIHASSPRKNPLLMSSPYRSKPIMPARSSPSGNEQCAGCEKTVYFAEGVNAIGKRWHKPCLRCASCRSTVDPGRVQDRDDLPYCKNCYTRDFGPTVLR